MPESIRPSGRLCLFAMIVSLKQFGRLSFVFLLMIVPIINGHCSRNKKDRSVDSDGVVITGKSEETTGTDAALNSGVQIEGSMQKIGYHGLTITIVQTSNGPLYTVVEKNGKILVNNLKMEKIEETDPSISKILKDLFYKEVENHDNDPLGALDNL